jgi:hypothetical protein
MVLPALKGYRARKQDHRGETGHLLHEIRGTLRGEVLRDLKGNGEVKFPLDSKGPPQVTGDEKGWVNGETLGVDITPVNSQNLRNPLLLEFREPCSHATADIDDAAHGQYS